MNWSKITDRFESHSVTYAKDHIGLRPALHAHARSIPPHLVPQLSGVLSQFTSEGRARKLKEFIHLPGVYVTDRLGADNEALLLTNDGKLQAQIDTPRHKMPKSYGRWRTSPMRPPMRLSRTLRRAPARAEALAAAHFTIHRY
ncbi:MAG: hypothetical protein EON54_03920 [Alcaligenaceae bacterium]|nr:MAG: hypothetical protein EON54_03920 [Alcaligenaceae bacterium]